MKYLIFSKSNNKIEKNATEHEGGKYDPYYTVWTSFDPKTKYFPFILQFYLLFYYIYVKAL